MRRGGRKQARASPARCARATRRLAARKLLLGYIVAAVGLALAWVAWESVNGVPFQDRYEVKVEVAGRRPDPQGRRHGAGRRAVCRR